MSSISHNTTPRNYRAANIVSEYTLVDKWKRQYFEYTFLTQWEYDMARRQINDDIIHNESKTEIVIIHEVEIRLGDEVNEGDDDVCEPDLYVLSFSVFDLVE